MKIKYLNNFILLASLLALSVFFNNCNSEKRFGFREKIRVDNKRNFANAKDKIAAESIQISMASNENNKIPQMNAGVLISKNLEKKAAITNLKLPVEMVTAIFATSNPEVLKKQQENEQARPAAMHPKEKSKEKSVLSIIALVFIWLGIIALITGIIVASVSHGGGGFPDGCAFILFGPISILIGIILSLISNFK